MASASRRLAGAAALSLSLAVAAGGARAQTGPRTTPAAAARADALFQEGKRLFDAGKHEQACDKLAESERIDPSIGTLGLLAACHEQRGLLATAHDEYKRTAARARRAGDDREKYARSRAAALEPRLPTVRLRFATAEAGVEVLRDGRPLPPAQVGGDARLDPGAHTFEVRATARKPWRTSITIKEREHLSIDVPELEPADPSTALGGARGPLPSSGGAEAEPAEPAGDAPAPSTDPRRLGGFIAAGVGAAGIAVGAVAGIVAMSKQADSEELCRERAGRYECTPEGGELVDGAKSAALVSTIAFGVGVAGIGAGAVLLLTSGWPAAAPRARGGAPRLAFAPAAGPGVAIAALRGTF